MGMWTAVAVSTSSERVRDFRTMGDVAVLLLLSNEL
jgi:hypothetical protein